MARRVGKFGLYAGGSEGGDGNDKWDLKPIYRSLAAAYGWTYSEIDSHTLPEVRELFDGWSDHPPTNLLVKAIVEGLGGGKPKTYAPVDVPPEAFEQMQKSALAAIAVKAGPRVPIIHGKDKGLPKAAPIFDLDELRKRNAERASRIGRLPDV